MCNAILPFNQAEKKFEIKIISCPLWTCQLVVVMPRTILPRRNRKCALSATGTRKPEEEKDTRCVTCFMEENVISPREVARFDEHKRD